MKISRILSVIIFCLFISQSAIAQYAPPIEIFDAGNDFIPAILLVEDFNNDTKPDIISCDFITKEFALLKNTGNSQMDVSFNIVADSTINWLELDVTEWSRADINNDGFVDLFYAYYTFFWLENDGTGNFTKGTDINFEGITSIYSVIDLNNDGALDFAYLTLARELKYVQNNGDGTFADPIILESNVPLFSNARGYKFGDINYDGDLDLILNNFDSLQIHINNGSNSFMFQEVIPISETIYGLEISDFDSDGDIDIIASISGGENIFVNNPGGWTEDTLLRRVGYQYQLDFRIVDLDLNGQSDIVKLQVYLDEDYEEYTKLVWYKNYNNGDFTDTIILIDTSNIREFALEDFDEDGKLDLAYITLETNGIEVFDGNIGWINNTELINNFPSTDEVNIQLSTTDFSIISRNIVFSNLDDDQQTEFLVSNVGKTLKQNLTLFNGEPINEFFKDTLLIESPFSLYENDIDEISKVLVGDVNGDDIKDVIQKIGTLEYVVFQPNDINNIGEAIHVNIDPTSIRDFKFFGLHDRENDGDLDIYSSFKFDNGWKLVWLLNNGAGVFDNFSYIENTPYNYAAGYSDMFIADIDGDLDDDIIAFSNEAVVWYLNLGSGNNGTANLIPITTDISQLNVEVVDVDQDGSSELFIYTGYVACLSHFCFYTTEFFIYNFDHSNQSFELMNFNNSWPLEIYGGLLEVDGFQAYSSDVNFELVYRDYNNDGNTDIITIQPDDGTLMVLLGDGLGNFIDQQTILTSDIFKIGSDITIGANRVGLYEVDIEGDGDLDLIYILSTNSNGGIYLIENLEINLAVDADEDGIALFYDCDDNDSTILDVLDQPEIQTTLQNCVGDQIEFEITNTSNNATYTWLTPNETIEMANFILESIALDDAGIYTVQSFLNNCESEVAIANIDVSEYPDVTIELSNDSLVLVGNNLSELTIQWFLNGNEITNANEDYFIPTETGNYHVVVTNQNDCSNTSDEFQHIVNGVKESKNQEIDVFPNPIKNGAYLKISLREMNDFKNASYSIQSINGQSLQIGQLNNSNSILIDNLQQGLYILELSNKSQKRIAFFIVAE